MYMYWIVLIKISTVLVGAKNVISVIIKLFDTLRMKTLLMLRSSQVNSVSVSTSLQQGALMPEEHVQESILKPAIYVMLSHHYHTTPIHEFDLTFCQMYLQKTTEKLHDYIFEDKVQSYLWWLPHSWEEQVTPRPVHCWTHWQPCLPIAAGGRNNYFD